MFDSTTPINDLIRAHAHVDPDVQEAAAEEIRRRDAELNAYSAEPAAWEQVPYAERQRREAAMKLVVAGIDKSASITADFPKQGSVAIHGAFTIEELRRLLAAMEGR